MRRVLVALAVSMALPMHASILWQIGEAAPPIVVSAAAPVPVKHAADELAYWLGEATGESWRVTAEAPEAGQPAIYLGEAATEGVASAPMMEELPPDGYWFKADGRTIRIAGRDYPGGPLGNWQHPLRNQETWNPALQLSAFGEMGTWGGVHHLLESLGFRWYMPGELGTVVPALQELTVEECEFQDAPAFEYRYAWLCDFNDSPQDALWYRRIGYGGAAPVNINHSFWMMLEYKDSHPGIFALVGGERDTTNLCASNGYGMECLSNEMLVDLWVGMARRYFKSFPSMEIFPVCPNDGLERICECGACQAQLSPHLGEDGVFSNYVWRFVAKVAERVGEEFPGKRVGCFAYERYRAVPDCLDRLPPNLAVLICYQRQELIDPERRASIKATVEKWSGIVKDGIYLWTYPHLNYWQPWRGHPRFYPHLVAEDIRQNSRLKVKGEFLESESFNHNEPERTIYDFHWPGLNHLTAYLAAKLLWHPELDVDALLEEYYAGFYGPAAAEMKEFWERVEEITMKGVLRHPFDMYTVEEARHLAQNLRDAEEKCPEESPYRRRIRLIREEFNPGLRGLLLARGSQKPVEAPYSKTPLLLNGTPWEGAKRYEMVTNQDDNPPVKTEIFAASDEEGLVFTFICHEPDKKRPDAKAKTFDDKDICKDDVVELFFCHPDLSGGTHYIVNSNGAVADYAWNNQDAAENIAWDAKNVTTFAEPGDGRWIAQIKIPWENFDATGPGDFDIIGNIYRTRPTNGREEHAAAVATCSYARLAPSAFPLILVPVFSK